MHNYIDSCHRESERCEAYPEKSASNFENVANITFDRDSVILQVKENDSDKNHQINPYDINKTNKSINEMRAKFLNKMGKNI